MSLLLLLTIRIVGIVLSLRFYVLQLLGVLSILNIQSLSQYSNYSEEPKHSD